MLSGAIRYILIECNARMLQTDDKGKEKLLGTYSIKNSLQIRKNRTNIIKKEWELRCKTMSAQFVVVENEL